MVNEINKFIAGCNISLLQYMFIRGDQIYIEDETKQEEIVDCINRSSRFPNCSWDKDTKALIFK